MKVPSIGRVVHYVIANEAWPEPRCQAALIVGVHDDGIATEMDVADLTVLMSVGLLFAEECQRSDTHEHNTWHWPERVEDR
jgi:hypothetical protein